MAILDIPEYTVELWTNTGTYVADVSNILSTTLRIDFALNDVEQVAFSLDLVQFELKCSRIGASPRNILNPYTSEVRIRRNGEYLVGAQVVQVQANFNNSSSNTIEVKCTGYLNYFKDRYITKTYNNMTYAEIARQLILDTQAQTYGDFGVTLGVDQASANQQSTRQRTYDLQNIKDGIISLTSLENDNFDFDFTHDKVFNVYSRKGSDKPEVELVYPQNINSMTVSRDASTLANKIIAVGSGIGEERIQSIATDNDSALTYFLREKTQLYNSVSTQSVLDAHSFGDLNIYKDLYEVPSLNLITNTIDLEDVKVGDAFYLRVDESSFIDNVDGMFRIMKTSISIDKNNAETVSLSVEAWNG